MNNNELGLGSSLVEFNQVKYDVDAAAINAKA